MRKIVRRIMCMLFAVSMIVTMCVSVSADDVNHQKEFFRFVGEPDPISGIAPALNSNGDFDFEMKTNVTSAKFVANSDTLTISTIARLYSSADHQYHDIDRKYTITLYHDGFWVFNSKVGTLTAYSDNLDYSASFSVKSGSTYYIEVEVSTALTSTSYTMIGSGNISPITLK